MSQEHVSSRPRLSYLLRLLHQHYASAVEETLLKSGFEDLRPGAAKVFPFLPAEGIQLSELAERAGVRKQTMAEAVGHLEKAGYVVRRPNTQDARSRLIFLTEKGRAAKPAVVTAGDLVEEHWAKLTSTQEVEQLRLMLQDFLMRVSKEVP
jgi:DNA-binding MarR family transcriptional regulator